ncbi:MAG: class I SAM-dependent methyltransferase [Telmatospirillum sp.]|nr:class I SAM-dependent methyltransferase [Telmatospirillum sp.]
MDEPAVNDFSADWLALRAPADASARSRKLARAFAAALKPRAIVADLGSGTGAMMRWLGPLLPPHARWRLVEGDARLLTQAPRRAQKIRRSLGGKLPHADAYVSSALIDLVGVAWLCRLLRATRGKPLLMGLAVDGRHKLVPPHRDDAAVFAAFAHHQRRFKGLGPALGGTAPFMLAQLAACAGYRVELAASDWHLPSGKLLEATLDGIAAAACEADPSLELADWRRVRARQLAAGQLTLMVGHRDLLAVRHRRRPICRPD